MSSINLLNNITIFVGYTTIWHMMYSCPPVINRVNLLIHFFHGNLIKKNSNDKKI